MKEHSKCFAHDKKTMLWDKIGAGFALRQLKLCADCEAWLIEIFPTLIDEHQDNDPRPLPPDPPPARDFSERTPGEEG